MQQESTDGVFSYACTVLNDGLLLSELRDTIHHGNGPRIIHCWKFMLLYFKAYNHHKYALEAFRLLLLTNGISSPLVKEQITWSRTVNTQGGRCNNIPINLFNEHLNRTLKDSVEDLGGVQGVQLNPPFLGILNFCNLYTPKILCIILNQFCTYIKFSEVVINILYIFTKV